MSTKFRRKSLPELMGKFDPDAEKKSSIMEEITKGKGTCVTTRIDFWAMPGI